MVASTNSSHDKDIRDIPQSLWQIGKLSRRESKPRPSPKNQGKILNLREGDAACAPDAEIDQVLQETDACSTLSDKAKEAIRAVVKASTDR